jgi:hypothetical protein
MASERIGMIRAAGASLRHFSGFHELEYSLRFPRDAWALRAAFGGKKRERLLRAQT